MNRHQLQHARRLRAHGVSRHIGGFSSTLVKEAARAGLPLSLLVAVCNQESGFSNVFGHDPGGAVVGGRVTEASYRGYRSRLRAGRGHNQGVGPFQLTSENEQEIADRLGGCWKPTVNARTAAAMLAGLVRSYGTRDGVRRYNGSGPAAERYAENVLAQAATWHRILVHG
jgi:hypothetical protein